MASSWLLFPGVSAETKAQLGDEGPNRNVCARIAKLDAATSNKECNFLNLYVNEEHNQEARGVAALFVLQVSDRNCFALTWFELWQVSFFNGGSVKFD